MSQQSSWVSWLIGESKLCNGIVINFYSRCKVNFYNNALQWLIVLLEVAR